MSPDLKMETPTPSNLHPSFEDGTEKITGKVVEILVGLSMTPFSVHETLLRDSSPFFNAAMNPQWKESQDRVIKMPDDNSGVFAMFVHWVYYKTLPGIEHLFTRPAGNLCEDLARAYVLGDKLLCRDFQYQVIDCLIKISQTPDMDGKRWVLTNAAVKCLYEGTNPSDPVRRLVVDLQAQLSLEDLSKQFEDEELPRAFLTDMITALFSVAGATTRKKSLRGEDYHHKEEEVD